MNKTYNVSLIITGKEIGALAGFFIGVAKDYAVAKDSENKKLALKNADTLISNFPASIRKPFKKLINDILEDPQSNKIADDFMEKLVDILKKNIQI